MRPNVDIPWTVHGQIKEHAQNQEITIEDAYIQTLKTGLSNMPTPVHTENKLDQFGTTQYPFGPRLIPVTNDEARDINDVCTFFPYLGTPGQPVTFKTYRRNIDADELEDSLIRLFTLIESPHQDWFTFHQLGGAWVGSGVNNFLHLIQTAPDRLADTDFKTYKIGFAIYIVEIKDGEYLSLRLEITDSGKIKNFSVGFLTDGHPVDGTRFQKYIAQFGLTELSNGRDKEIQRISVKPDDRIEVEVADPVVRNPRSEDEPWVAGLIIENPLQEHEDLHEKFLSEMPEEKREHPAYRNRFKPLASYDHAYVQLKTHHPVSEDRSYELQGITAEDLSPIFGRESIWNLGINANW